MRLYLIGILCISIFRISAQEKPLVDSLPEVYISALPYSKRTYQEVSTQKHLNFVNALKSSTSLQVQQGSPGGLATGLSNGMGARHLAILWNDWNIQSPLNGTYDLYQIPHFLFSDSHYLNQSHSSSHGTAAMAGALILGQNQKSGLQVKHVATTNQDQIYAVAIDKRSAKNKFRLGLQQNNSQFRYPYLNRKNKTIQDEAKYTGTDLLISNTLAIKKGTNIHASLWHQDISRNLSSSKTSQYNGEQQKDKNTRISLDLKHFLGNKQFSLKTAYFDEYLGYFSNTVDSRANNHVKLIEGVFFQDGKRNTLVKLKYRKDQVFTNFNIEEVRQTLGLHLRHQIILGERIAIKGQISKNWVDTYQIPWTWSIQNTYFIKDELHITIDYSKNFNLPTFNDLYWPSGGNDQLQSERSHQVNWAILYNEKLNSTPFNFHVKGQYQQVDNWILWSPDNGLWTPKNQRSVKHFGIIVKAAFSISHSNQNRFDVALQSSLSRTVIDQDQVDQSLIGNQLIYIPKQQHNLQLTWHSPSIEIALLSRLVGKRYTSSDNLAFLPRYTTTDLTLSSNSLGNVDLGMWLTFHNILNTDYEIIPFFPTPLRYVSLGISFSIN